MFSATQWLVMASGIWQLNIKEKYQIPYKIYRFYIRLLYVLVAILIHCNLFYYLGKDNNRGNSSLNYFNIPFKIITSNGFSITALEILAHCINLFQCLIKLAIFMRKRVVELVKIAHEDTFNDADNIPECNQTLKKCKSYVAKISLFNAAYCVSVIAFFTTYGGDLL